MNPQSDVMQDFPIESRAVAPARITAGRRFYWSIRRELWENRSLYLAPLATAAFILLGFFISLLSLRHGLSQSVNPVQQHGFMHLPLTFAALFIMATTSILTIFYCLDALYGERRDRSILFWKSLPVSDLITVLSKASIPLIVLPLLGFAITFVTQALMLLMSGVILFGTGFAPAALGDHVSFFQMSIMLLYHLVAIHGLWYAPVYAWLLLVSAWARRAPVLWAILPPFGIAAVEKIAFHTSYFIALLHYRAVGAPGSDAFTISKMTMNSPSYVTLGRFLATPGLWTGLLLAAIFLACAVELRRRRDPI